ncbi:hypothetical protein LSH36_481g03064 [Paralvinella palmiformis]|uniref:Uncharacterized protein n=1 Tax=Paralvinella palmiformis TaxID=53620 RepID=A0AAD9J983_9ANNE|nr:hypothetical protein LSH36_481g03064 [Paralvinella palmiformis]
MPQPRSASVPIELGFADMAIKECLICLLIVVVLGYGEAYNSGGCTPNKFSIYGCLITNLRWLNSEEKCSWDAMKRSSTNRNTARIISDCREGDCQDADSSADQAANRYGRSGGNCASRYLCNVNCKYNPRDGSCKQSNC